MADCVSLPNAAELVEMLHTIGACVEHGDACVLCKGESKPMCRCEKETALQAADAIEELLAENAKLKAELDAAVALLKEESYCYSCKQCTERDGSECWCAALGDWSEWYDGCDAWEWRGVQKEEEDGTD